MNVASAGELEITNSLAPNSIGGGERQKGWTDEFGRFIAAGGAL